MYKHSICNIFSTINGMHATYCTIFRSVIEALIFPYKISTNANNTGGPMLPLETITFSLRVIVTYDFSRFAYIFLYFPRRFLNAGHCASMWLSARCSFSSFPPPTVAYRVSFLSIGSGNSMSHENSMYIAPACIRHTNKKDCFHLLPIPS